MSTSANLTRASRRRCRWWATPRSRSRSSQDCSRDSMFPRSTPRRCRGTGRSGTRKSTAFTTSTPACPSAKGRSSAWSTKFPGRGMWWCAPGSLPGDLHKLWRTRDPNGYHLEYGYSCMGYEIAGGLGVRLAAPDRDVYVMVGDGSYLMMAQEIVTAVQ